jgi:hypothetical protein
VFVFRSHNQPDNSGATFPCMADMHSTESISMFGMTYTSLISWLFMGTVVFGADNLEYNRDVRPILAENCFACHGFDKAKREAGLRLDTMEGAVEKLDSGQVAIQPGKPDESELILRILATDDSVMPPHETGKTLTEVQKDVLRKWVSQGARYDKHWAFIAPQKTAIPETTLAKANATTNPIDSFILAKLEAENLLPTRRSDYLDPQVESGLDWIATDRFGGG